MTDSRDDTADIAWMRTLAEAGTRAPFRGASILMAAGLIFGTTSLLFWAQTTELLPGGVVVVGGVTVFGIVWLIGTVVFLAVCAALIARIKAAGGVTTAANRAVQTVWSGAGWGIFTLFTALAVYGFRMGPDQGIGTFALIPSIVLVFYGVGWGVTAAMFRDRRLGGLAFASFVAAPVLAAFAGSPHQYLAYAVALFALMALPGFLLMRAARS